MARAYPQEFRDDVVAVARKHEAPLTQIAKDFGISDATLAQLVEARRHRRRTSARQEAGGVRGVSANSADASRPWSKRTRSCVARPPTSPSSCPKMKYPLVRELSRDGIPVTVTCGC